MRPPKAPEATEAPDSGFTFLDPQGLSCLVVVVAVVGPINPTDTRPFHTSGLRVKMGNGAASR